MRPENTHAYHGVVELAILISDIKVEDGRYIADCQVAWFKERIS